jgi:hypothetical protein
MTRYEELTYLFGDAHLKECCDFANFLAGGLAEYLGCERDQIGFVSKQLPDTAPLTQCDPAVADKWQGFIYTTIAVKLPNEPILGDQVRAVVRLRKIQDSFHVQIDHGMRQPHLLHQTDREALHTFYESLFDSFISMENWEAF